MQGPRTDITIGVDAHLDTHVAVALDSEGRLLSTTSIPTTGDGYSQFVSWAAQLGDITQVGIEGTATFGAGLARHLAGLGVQVIDVDQPDRRLRRRRGKTDAIDARSQLGRSLTDPSARLPSRPTVTWKASAPSALPGVAP